METNVITDGIIKEAWIRTGPEHRFVSSLKYAANMLPNLDDMPHYHYHQNYCTKSILLFIIFTLKDTKLLNNNTK